MSVKPLFGLGDIDAPVDCTRLCEPSSRRASLLGLLQLQLQLLLLYDTLFHAHYPPAHTSSIYDFSPFKNLSVPDTLRATNLPWLYPEPSNEQARRLATAVPTSSTIFCNTVVRDVALSVVAHILMTAQIPGSKTGMNRGPYHPSKARKRCTYTLKSQVCLDPHFSLFTLSFLAHTRVDKRTPLSLSWTIILRRHVQCPFISQNARNLHLETGQMRGSFYSLLYILRSLKKSLRVVIQEGNRIGMIRLFYCWFVNTSSLVLLLPVIKSFRIHWFELDGL